MSEQSKLVVTIGLIIGWGGHAYPKNFEISYLLECYFLHFQEQLKMYFTKKSNYRVTQIT